MRTLTVLPKFVPEQIYTKRNTRQVIACTYLRALHAHQSDCHRYPPTNQCHVPLTQVILNLYVKPDLPVVSYLPALTGLSADLVQRQGIPLAQAVAMVKSCLPQSAVLVGQNILQVW